MNIILLGFHGSGKTVVGKMLADQLWATFVDVDETVAAQFAREGLDGDLAAVTAAQAKMLAALSEDPQTIVAASSVAVPEESTAQALKAHSRLVYLRAEPAVLTERIAADPIRARANYPQFRRTEIADVAAGLTNRDAAWAAMADLTLETGPMNPQTIVRLVVRMAM